MIIGAAMWILYYSKCPSLLVDPRSKFYRRAMWKVPIYPRDFGRVANPYPRWIKQGTSRGPSTNEGECLASNYQPLTRGMRNPELEYRPNHPREQISRRDRASVRMSDYHGKRETKRERPVLLLREGFCRNSYASFDTHLCWILSVSIVAKLNLKACRHKFLYISRISQIYLTIIKRCNRN